MFRYRGIYIKHSVITEDYKIITKNKTYTIKKGINILDNIKHIIDNYKI